MVQKRKNTVEKYKDKTQKQREKVLKKYSKFSDFDIDEICTYLQVKIEGSKLWIGASLTLLVAFFVNKHDSFIKTFFYTIIAWLNNWANYGILKPKYINRDARSFTNFIEFIVFICFFIFAGKAFVYQRDLIWLLKIKKHKKDAK